MADGRFVIVELLWIIAKLKLMTESFLTGKM